MSFPTTNWRCNRGFRSSSSIVHQGTYFNSILEALFFRFGAFGFGVARRVALRFGSALCFAAFVVFFLLVVRFAFAISVYPAFVNCNRIVVQVAVR